MSCVYKSLMNKASFSSLKCTIKSTLSTPSTPMISRSYTCSSSKFFFPIRTYTSQIRHFSLTSSPSERLSAQSLLPLHNAVSVARMSTSCLSKSSKGCRGLTKGRTGNSAGRNSKGRITIFHRGGGAKRLHRQIDLKRSTSSLGIVERIEYDPNRSSRIAAIRWIEGAQLGSPSKCNSVENFACPQKILEPTTTTIASPFMFSSLPGMVDQRQVPWSKSPFSNTGLERKKTCLKDVFFSAFSSPKVKGESASLSYVSSFAFPRIAVAGAKPAFFAPRIRDEVRGKNMSSLCKIRKLRTDSTVWAHRLKRKAAVSWNGSRLQETLALVRAAERKERRGKVGQVSKADRAPVTYVIASHQLEEGKMVMNYGSKPSTSHLLRTGLNAA